MGDSSYWDKKHQKYAGQDWITKPTIFATQVASYFPKSGKILDLGCGQGQDSIYFAKLGYKVTACDFSGAAIDLTRERVPTELKDKLTFQVLDLSAPLPFASESFEVVYGHLALQYFDSNRTQELFNEIHTVLSQGGVFVALFNTLDDPEAKQSRELESGLYEVDGLAKRFFSVETLKPYVQNFETLLLDNKGETHKDKIKTLIRFVGRKLLT